MNPGRFALVVLAVALVTGCVYPRAWQRTSPSGSSDSTTPGELVAQVEIKGGDGPELAMLWKAAGTLLVELGSGQRITLVNPQPEVGELDLEVVPLPEGDHLLVTVADDRITWAWVLVPPTMTIALEVQVDWGVTIVGDQIKVSHRKYLDEGGFRISSTLYSYAADSGKYEANLALSREPRFSVESLEGIGRSLDDFSLSANGIALGFDGFGQASVWGEFPLSMFQSDLQVAAQKMPSLAREVLFAHDSIASAWIFTDSDWGQFAYAYRLQRLNKNWTSAWVEPTRHRSSTLWHGEYDDPVLLSLREVFGERLLHVDVYGHRVNQARVIAEVSPASDSATQSVEVAHAFRAVMGRLGSEVNRVEEMVLKFPDGTGAWQEYSMSWIQFEWWRRQGMVVDDWAEFSRRPIISMDGAQWDPWVANADMPNDLNWIEIVGRLRDQTPGAEILFAGWNNGGLMVAVWVPEAANQATTWADQFAVAERVMQDPRVLDLRIVSPGTKSPRVSKLTRQRYELLTRSGDGEFLPFSRIPTGHWPFIVDGYWDTERP